MKKIFKSEQQIRKETYEVVPLEVLEKDFIINFLKNIPLNYLKKLVCFSEFNFENTELYKEERNINFLKELKYKGVILFKSQLLIDCLHENINREDGLDECFDCGVRNY